MTNEIALIYALTKIYDNYITPLNTRVKCWKARIPGWKNAFLVGMTVKQIEGAPTYITWYIPNEFWDKFKLIETKEIPEIYHTDNIIELMKL